MEPRSLRQLVTAHILAWTIGGIMTSLAGWAPLDMLGRSPEPLLVIAGVGLGVGCAAFLARPLLPDTRRVIVLKLVAGAIFIPIGAIFYLGASAYFLVAIGQSLFDQVLRILVLACLVLWCWLQVREFRDRIEKTRFMEKEFHVEDDRIVMRFPVKTDLSAPHISEKTVSGMLYNKLGPYLLMLLPFAYPLQRLFVDSGGAEGLLLLLAILCVPLTFYLAGKLACGAYLNIYRVRQLERQHGKPVVFGEDAFPNSAKR